MTPRKRVSPRLVAFGLSIFLGTVCSAPPGQLSEILAAPALAPAVEAVLNDPGLINELRGSPLVSVFGADPPAVVELASSPTFQSVASNQQTLQEVLSSPKLLQLANAPNAPQQAAALLSASRAPATGDAQTDLSNLIRALGLAPTPNRKMLRKS